MNVYVKAENDQCMLEHGSNLAAGWDLKYNGTDEIVIPPCTRSLVPTGVRIAMDRFTFGKIEGRSGHALKNGIMILAGVIDSDYRGEIKVIMYNSDMNEPFVIKPFDRIAQLVFLKTDPTSIKLINVDELGETARGAMGFGSTGN